MLMNDSVRIEVPGSVLGKAYQIDALHAAHANIQSLYIHSNAQPIIYITYIIIITYHSDV